MKLILLRHGKTEANEKHLYCGFRVLPLSEAGIVELRELKNIIAYPDIAGYRVVTSGMRRCDDTLSIIFGGTRHEVEPDLREMNFGRFEMRSYEEMKNDPEYIAWISCDNDANLTPGGESGKQMKARVLAALERLLDDGRDALLVVHGGVIAAIMEWLFSDECKNCYEWQPKPGRGYIVDTAKREYTTI